MNSGIEGMRSEDHPGMIVVVVGLRLVVLVHPGSGGEVCRVGLGAPQSRAVVVLLLRRRVLHHRSPVFCGLVHDDRPPVELLQVLLLLLRPEVGLHDLLLRRRVQMCTCYNARVHLLFLVGGLWH